MSLVIEKAVYGGDGIGHAKEGRLIFVPFVLPGEGVRIGPAQISGGSFRAMPLLVETESRDRVVPRCRHFGTCGGCHYQHASYDLQLAMKANILGETLERAGVRNASKLIVHAATPWEYRNRVGLRVESVEDEIRFGYNLRDTKEFVAIEECPISSPLLWRTAGALRLLSGRNLNCNSWLRGAREVELFATGDQRFLQMSLHLRKGKLSGFREFCEEVREVVPELVGAGAILEGVEQGRWGKDGLTYVVADKGFWVSRGGFFQVNRFLLEELVGVVTGGRKGLIAWDLFSGVGLFSRVLAERFGRVLAVDANATAIRDLASAKVANIQAMAAPVVEFLRRAVLERERPELVVIDPPRAGVRGEVSGLLVRLQVPEIVYVACDPTTLARDLRVMVDSGYNLAELHMVDLFPQTYHLETVAILQR